MVDLKSNEHASKQENAPKTAIKKGFGSIFHRFETCEIYRRLQTNIGWTEEFCKHLDELAKEDHSNVATRQEREEQRRACVSNLGQNKTTPVRSRADVPVSLRKFLEAKQEAAEAGHQLNPTI